uniref:Activin_recp domain-containing protein n=1 Tax=Syphacia muris TaxID=451379 RepID=A0A0N5AE65_9BILA
MGSCEADYCYIERKPADGHGKYWITKGCVRRPPRKTLGCDYDYFQDHILCVCYGRFCNDAIYFRPVSRRNVTCRKCPERDPDCGDTCQGQWCHEDTTTGSAGCGYGPPALPFFYKSPDLLARKSRICISISRGTGKAHRHCVCRTNNCNDFNRPYYPWEKFSGDLNTFRPNAHTGNQLTLQRCVSCEVTSHNIAASASCKQDTCIGHFCTYATQRSLIAGKNRRYSIPALSERQGCINVTDSENIQLGCTHKWMDNEEEQLFCACKGDMCNQDLATASLSQTAGRVPCTIIITITLLLLCYQKQNVI